MGGKTGYPYEKNRTEETKKEESRRRRGDRGREGKEKRCVNSKLKNTNRCRGKGKFTL